MSKTTSHIAFPEGSCIHDLFETQVAQKPDHPALVFEGRSLSYRQLSKKSNQLARHLLKLGLRPGDHVAICLERSMEMFIGLLGIIKAGAAYCPIDPTYPAARQTFMLQDTEAKLLLTQSSLLTQLQPLAGDVPVICLDTDWPAIAEQKKSTPPVGLEDHHLIYTIFTSGSTGQPKGVQVEHRNVANLIEGQLNFVQHPVQRFLYAYSFAFDGSVLLIWWTLLQGATLVIGPEGLEKDVQQLATFVESHQVSHLLTFPSVYSILLEKATTHQLRFLESVSVAGEACPGALVQQHHRLLPNCCLLNQYGPTEATVGCTIHITDPQHEGPKVPIGRPINNCEIYLLDDQLNPVPDGDTGEIFIGGRPVARGYLNRPELTRQRFLNNTFTSAFAKWDANRMYRTGDLARRLPDGQIDFIGRVDHQVKLRGYRIELGEVEAAVLAHPFVREAAVSVFGESPTDQKLVAHIVLQQGEELSTSDLRNFLATQLPEYMVPASYVQLDRMPLSPSGKVDRKNLPQPSRERPALQQEYVAPQTALEKYIATLWCEMLELDRVGIHDKFFELG
ncbi:MAG: amino acid adenylation domain-containing protein, partial [Bacteroidota bacterium]